MGTELQPDGSLNPEDKVIGLQAQFVVNLVRSKSLRCRYLINFLSLLGTRLRLELTARTFGEGVGTEKGTLSFITRIP